MDGQVQGGAGGRAVPEGASALGQQSGQAHDPAGAQPAGHAPRGVPVPGPVRHGGMLDDVPVPVRFLLGGLLALMLVVTGIGFRLSYESLHRWAEGHGLNGQAAWAWPAVIDSFIAIGEVGSSTWLWLRRGHPHWWGRVSWYFLAITVVGFGESLGANMAEAGADPGDRFTAALPPAAALLAFAGLARIGHELLARRQGHAHVSVPAVPVEVPEPGPVPVPAERPAPAVPVPVLPVASPVVPAPVPARRVAAARAPRPTVVVPLPTSGEGQDSGHKMSAEQAQAWYRSHLDAGRDPLVAEMMEATGMKERWVKIQRQAVKRAWKAEQARQAEQAAAG